MRLPPKILNNRYQRHYCIQNGCPRFFSQVSSASTLKMPHLPVVDTITQKFISGSIDTQNLPLKKTGIVYIHHPLITSLNVVDGIIKLGANPNNIFVLGKKYSECPSVVTKMISLGVRYQKCSAQMELGKFSIAFIRDINWLWLNVITSMGNDVEELIILDHGGHALLFAPEIILNRYKVIGIEKTTAGLMSFNDQGIPPFPIINVAGCAAKRFFESPLIADAVINKLQPLLPNLLSNMIPGVVGYGAIGKSLVNKLISIGHRVLVYDHNPQKLASIKHKQIISTNELPALIASSNYIFGCTGQDITKALEFFRLSAKDKTLISCSSEDREFLTLLNLIQRTTNRRTSLNPLENLEYETDMGAKIKILKGGFPVNFDNSGESVTTNDIQLTRALILGGVFQAIKFFKKPWLINKGNIFTLDPYLQKIIVSEWLKYQPENRFCKSTIERFYINVSNISDSSDTYEPCDIFEISTTNPLNSRKNINASPFCFQP